MQNIVFGKFTHLLDQEMKKMSERGLHMIENSMFDLPF